MDDFDIADPELYRSGDPVGTWARLRATSPVFWNRHPPGAGFWAVMTHAAALQVYRDTESFTSERGMRIDSDPAAVAAAAGRLLIVTDPPLHPRIRQVMKAAFVPRIVATLESTMRKVVEPLLERALGGPPINFVSAIAAALPAAIICDIMDVPPADRDMMVGLTSRAFGASVSESGCPVAETDQAEAHSEIFLYYSDLVDQRRRKPGADVISALVEGRVEGRRLSNEEVLLNCDGLVTGANETTRHASAAGLLALIDNPAEWQRLRAREVSLESAAEEILRFTTPALHVMRVAKRDVTIGGQEVCAADAVTVWNGSANRDEAVFRDPDRFDLGREPNRHLTFGIGQHFCLGAMLARVELRFLLGLLAERVTTVELAGEVRRTRSNFMWGIDELPVALR
jgi:cytochrome P450